MARLIAAFCLTLGVAVGASRAGGAQPVSDADALAARAVVSAELQAFASDDAKRAFSYAAPSIRAMFGTPERFLAMVRTGYPVVYRAAGMTFLIPLHVDGDLVQGVHLTDGDGALWLATYRLERQPDGTWRIAGCDVRAGDRQDDLTRAPPNELSRHRRRQHPPQVGAVRAPLPGAGDAGARRGLPRGDRRARRDQWRGLPPPASMLGCIVAGEASAAASRSSWRSGTSSRAGS